MQLKKIKMPKKKYFLLLSAITFLLTYTSCKEDNSEITGTAKIAVTNAALNSAPIDLYVDGNKITTAPLSYTNSTGSAGNPYLEMNAGIRAVKVISTASPDPVVEGNLVITPGENYSIFTYDTLDAYNHLKAMIVSDNLAAPSAGKAKFRFFNLSPGSKFLDLQISRTDDTTKRTGVAYVGNAAGSAGLSAFSEINTGLFSITIKQTDSSYNLITGESITFQQGKIYSIYVRGKIANGINTPQGFKISTIQHN